MAASIRSDEPEGAHAARPRASVTAPRPAPSHGCVIDLVHLSCITMGDKALERELLQAYATQSLFHRKALVSGDAQGAKRAAHMLVGSSRTIGANKAAQAALVFERDISAPVDDLLAALDETVAFIASLAD